MSHEMRTQLARCISNLTRLPLVVVLTFEDDELRATATNIAKFYGI